MLSGRCLCEGVRFSINGKLGPAGFCHCSQCRRANGSAFAANAPVRSQYFTINAGAELIQEYESSSGKFRTFCGRCGSPLYSHELAHPETKRVRLGTLNDDPGRRPLAHFHTESKADWYEIEDDLPRFRQGPDGPLQH